MSFIISKIVWAALTPGSILLMMLIIACGLHNLRPLISRGLLAIAVVFVAALGLSPIGNWILGPLESRFPPARIGQQRIDGIIVLGGTIDAEASNRLGMTVLNDSAERLTSFVALAKAHPEAKLVFSGGSGDPLRPELPEADQADRFFDEQGLPHGRVILERKSRNTYENAVLSKDLVHPQAGETWLLVTSAWHMPRAVGCFEKLGWKITPYPVDYRSASYDHWAMFLPEQQLQMVTVAIKEWVGLVSYRLMGRI